MSYVSLPSSHAVQVNVGTTINIAGTVSKDPYRFGINLFTGADENNSALHISNRFDGNVVVTNAKSQTRYGSEERPGQFPFARGESFIISIVTTADSFVIKVNGQLIHAFKHRGPFANVKRVSVFDNPKGGYPSVQITHVSVQNPGSPLTVFTHQVAMPHKTQVRLTPGCVIHMLGAVSHDPHRFNVNLAASPDESHNCLHFNPRFDANKLVLNAKNHGKYGGEEKPAAFPFTRGEGFHVIFRVQAGGYDVIINGAHVHTFNHRIPVDQVQSVVINDQPKGGNPSVYVAHVTVVGADGQTLVP